MSADDRIRQSAEEFCRRLLVDLSVQLEGFIVELARAGAEERAGAVTATTEKLTGELAAARAEAERTLQQEIARVRDEVEQAVRRAVSVELARLKAEIERLTVEKQRAAEETAWRARQEAEQSFELERARAALENEQAIESQVMTALADERQSQMRALERVAGVIGRLDQGQSLTEILTTLADGAAAEAPRVAVLTLQGDRIRSWRLLGFGPDAAPVDLERGKAGVVARALDQGTVAFAEPAAPGHPIPPGPGFTALPPDRSGFAIPIHVGGAPVAVLYADDATDAEQAKPTAWPEAIEIMTRHAALRLENLTAARTAQALSAGARASGAASNSPPTAEAQAGTESETEPSGDEEGSARRYARLLVSEIKLYNEAAVRVGRQKGDLLDRLRSEIDRAWKLYDQRVPATVPVKRALFDDELVQTLAGGDPTLLGPRTDALA